MPAGLHRLVATLVALAVATQAAVGLLCHGSRPLSDAHRELPWVHGPTLLALLLALTVAGDLVAVRLRHGEQTEELTLFEAALVIDVLLLPTWSALLLPVAASVVSSAIRRRALLKTVFNASNLALSTAVLVGIVHLLGGTTRALGVQAVLALLLGTLAFTVVNLVALSRVYGLLGDEGPWQIVRDGLRLSAVMAVGMVALGGTALTLLSAAPALLPFTIVPAGALTFAYRAAAQESDERERSSRLLALSQVLAGRLDADEVLSAFLDLTRQAFGADVALAVLGEFDLPGDGAPTTVVDDRETGRDRRTSPPAETLLLHRAGPEVLTAGLPEGCHAGVLAPLEAEGRRVGVVVLGTRDRHRALGARELTLLTPLASALAVALRGAAHLARLEEETSKLKAVVDQSSDGILVLDGAGTVQLWSPALQSLTGRPEASALGRPLGDLLTTTTVQGIPCDAFLVGRVELTPTTPQVVVELTVRRDDGEQRVVRCAHAGVFDELGVLQRDVVIVHDVTRERQVERLKADFIATVSHELRTPVTPIKGYADLLRRRGHLMDDAKRAECLAVISDRAEHLSRLVEDLLLASRISASEGTTAAQVDMGSNDLGALVRRGCADFGDLGERIALALPDEPIPVGCDPVRVIQVLTNLVGNALKYSTAGTPVDVTLTVEGRRAVVTVTDRGRGIPADQLEKVFEKFHRVEDPMLMTTGGTGLGLYIARQLTAAMGGTLGCTSTLNLGSVFTFALGLAGEPTPAPGHLPAGADAAGVTPPVQLASTAPRPRRAPPWAVAPVDPSLPAQETAGAKVPAGWAPRSATTDETPAR